MTNRGLYIHVPLCTSKCLYCDFYSLPVAEELVSQYLDAVVREIRLKGEIWGGPVSTVYFGGGTPSCLSLGQVATILRECNRFFTWKPGSEITFEINPNRGEIDYLRGLKSLGITRLSVGLQTAEPRHLTLLRRQHTVSDFYRISENIASAGFGNYSVDALYGFPEQTLDEYLCTLKTIVSAGVNHVSSYALQLEPHTPLAVEVAQGNITLPTEDEVADMMLAGRDYLVAQGLSHYELSNFAAERYESEHNTIYWENEQYIGLGPGASSFIKGRRFSNVDNLAHYAILLNANRLPVVACEQLAGLQEMGETMILGLRMLRKGVNRERFHQRFGCDCVQLYNRVVSKFVAQGLLEVTAATVRLTARGFPLANRVQMEFLP
ncbi:MAG: Oxygen-independent coproporphyrinogen-III oxidase-like protein YqeR [Firmicutes bacterium]|nr:Oxygen-independent coproporphyrinogen-III oxidase-like protein YqeR [Bacillota bacterium]